MAGRLSMVFVLIVTVAAALLQCSAAATYQVGDSTGWKIPTGTSYENWASNKNFVVGDILVFNFANGNHDVAEVTQAGYNGCSGTNPISLQSNGPARITLSTPGSHYYICTFPGHCGAGQKLSVNVTGSASSPAPQPSTPSTPSPVPTPSLAPQPSTPSPFSPSPSSPTASTPSSSDAVPPPINGAPIPPSSPSAPSSPSPTTAPPAPNAATSLGVVGLSSTILSIVVALMY